MSAQFSFRKRSALEKTKLFPGSDWEFKLWLALPSQWSTLDVAFRTYKLTEDIAAGYTYSCGFFYLYTAYNDADMRTYWEDPPIITEIP